MAWVYTLAVFNPKPLLPDLCFLVPFLSQSVFSLIDLFRSIKISLFVRLASEVTKSTQVLSI